MSFFTLEETKAKKNIRLTPNCGACQLYKDCKSPKMEPYGQFKKGILFLGEAPGCVSGDSLIQTAFRDKSIFPIGVPIKDLVGKVGFYVYSFDTNLDKLVIGEVNKVWKTGRKKVYRVIYEWSYSQGSKKIKKIDSIKVTANHKFLLKKYIKHDPFLGISQHGEYVSINDGLGIGDSIQPFHSREVNGYYHVGAYSRNMQKESRLLLSFKYGENLKKKEQCHHRNENKLDDSWENIELLSLKDHCFVHAKYGKDNCMANLEIRKKHAKVVQSKNYKDKMSKIAKKHLSDPKNYEKRIQQIHKQRKRTSKTVKEKFANDPQYYYNYLLGVQKRYNLDNDWLQLKFNLKFPNEIFPPIDNHKIIGVEYIGVEDVYDMEVEGYHNFAVNSIFVHNSTEDYHSKQFMGGAGKKLKEHCSNVGIRLHVDTLSINAINCHPKDKDGNNRTPTPKEIDYCRPIPYQVINKYKPKVIVLFGQSAIESFLGHRWTDRENGVGAITRWRGFAIPDRETGCWVIPTYHPSFIMRNDKEKVLKKLFESDLELALKHVDIPFPEFEDEKKYIIINTVEKTILDFLLGVNRGVNGVCCIDYETSGLKPHREGHYIRTCSISLFEKHAYAFPIANKKIRNALKGILENPNIKKVAHNLKYEDAWSQVILGAKPQGWVWDTMLTAHLLDNRRKITGLKFQTYVRYGVSGYDNLIEPYLKSKGKNANDFNNIGKAPLKDLLLYNGLDTIFTYKLFMDQVKEMGMTIGEVMKL